jgi:hypothetical protein
MSEIATLAARQLAAYNASDLDAFVACYHPDVVVRDSDEIIARGRDAFRERYSDLFARWEFGAEVPERVHHGTHCVDKETYWRTNPDTQEHQRDSVMVHYSLRDRLIGSVHFFSG